jgi:DNA polymerase (family 10)
VILDKIIQLCKEHKISQIEGFGEKSESEILDSIEKYKEGMKKDVRINLIDAIVASQKLLGYMKTNKNVSQAEVLGSLRRRCETVGDIDIAVATTNPFAVIDHFVKFKYVKKVIEKGENKASIEMSNGNHADLRVVNPAQWGTMLAHFTGSKEHNVQLREYALKKGWSISEYGIKKTQNSPQRAGQAPLKTQSHNLNLKTFETEEEFYKFLSLQYIAPEMRENTGEIEIALKHRLPHLIELTDVKGDLHMHTNFNIESSHDLGESTPEEMVDAGIKLGYKYLAFSEHNPSLSKHNKKTISEILKRKQQLVDQLNKKYRGRLHVFNSLEVDILPNGELAIEEEHLKYLDFVTASIHSSFERSSKEQTDRILRALEYPKVKILGHPTGRLVQKRDEIKFDQTQIFEKCRAKNIAVEIAASPFRNDPPWQMLKDLKSIDVSFIINTDAHHKNDLNLMKFGLWNARKGWLTKQDVINTRNISEIQKYLLD